MTKNTIKSWRFIGDDGTFRLDAPHRTSYLYFPLVNEAGMMSVVTPTLHGDLYRWLTGSASWYLLTLLTEVFGVRGHLGDLVLAPKLVASQFDARGEAAVRAQFAGRDLEVIYHNPRRLEYDAYVIRRIVMDGVDLPVTREGQGVRIGREVITDLNTKAPQRLDVELGS